MGGGPPYGGPARPSPPEGWRVRPALPSLPPAAAEVVRGVRRVRLPPLSCGCSELEAARAACVEVFG